MADTLLAQSGLAHPFAKPAPSPRPSVIYEGVGRVVPAPTAKPGIEETRYTPSVRTPPVTYDFSPSSLFKRQLSFTPPAQSQNVFQFVQQDTSTPASSTATKTPLTYEHAEPAALKIFREISNNGESRQQKFQQVNLFV